jgi:hypothetical protein
MGRKAVVRNDYCSFCKTINKAELKQQLKNKREPQNKV